MVPPRLLALLPAAGIATAAAAADPAPRSIPREAWGDRMETVLPTLFCKPDFYFRKCFAISARECEELAASSTRVCLGKLLPKMPSELRLPEDGAKWGKTVGACAGEAFETAVLKKKRSGIAKCDDPAAWR
jgi:hypothetical protein